jgi:hypothetical protein
VEELQTQIHLGESMLKLLDDYEFAEDEQVSIVFSKNSDHYSAFRSMFDQF